MFYYYVIQIVHKERQNLFSWLPTLQALGIIIYFALNNEPSTLVLVVLIIVAIILLYFAYYGKILAMILLMILIGFISVQIKTIILSDHLIKKTVYLKDIKATVKEIYNKPNSHQFLLYKIVDSPIQLNNIKVTIKTKIDQKIQTGDQVILSVFLYPPPIAINKFAYDYAKISYFNHVSAIGIATSNVILYKKQQKTFTEAIEWLRANIYQNLYNNIDSLEANIMSALLIGKKEGIPEDTVNNIRESGLSHLFAISGLHLVFVTSFFYIIFRRLFLTSETLSLKYNIKKISAVLGAFSGLVYLLLAGMPISAQRAFIMISLVFFAVLIDRKYNGYRSITVAALVILLFEPESIFNPSFQMSFFSVLGLIASYDLTNKLSFNNKIINYFLLTILSSIIATISTLPFVIYNFNYFSIGGFISNLLAIPITTFVIIPLGIIYIFLIPIGLSFLLSPLIKYSIDLLLYIATKGAEVSFLKVYVHSIPSYTVVIITLGILWLCLWQEKWRFLGIILILVGYTLGILYDTPDILINIKNGAIKEANSQLYTLTNRNKNYVISSWAKQNGQSIMYPHKKYLGEKFLSHNKLEYIYIKNGHTVVISYDGDAINQYCAQADLIIQMRNISYPQCTSPTITYQQLNTYGTHLIWVKGHKLIIEKVHTNRPWHQIQKP